MGPPMWRVEGIAFWPAWPPDASDFGDLRERRLARQIAGRRRAVVPVRLLPVLALGLAVIASYDARMAVTTVGLLVALGAGAIMHACAHRSPSSSTSSPTPRAAGTARPGRRPSR